MDVDSSLGGRNSSFGFVHLFVSLLANALQIIVIAEH